MKMTKYPARLLTLIALPLLIIGCSDQSAETTQPAEPQIRPVKVHQLGKPQTQPTRTLAGTIEAVDRADLSFRVSGKIAEIKVEVGAQVSEGDTLAVLDQTQLELALDSAKAQRLRAQAVMTDARQNYDAQKALVKRGVISRISFEGTAANLKSASAELESARAQENRAARDLEYAVLKAPFSGKVSSRSVDPFTNISAGQSVFQMVKEGQREVIVRLPLALLRYVNQQEPVQVTPLVTDALAADVRQSFSGIIHHIGANSEAGNAVTLKILLDDQARSLRSGLPAEVRFNLNYQDSGHLTVPFTAIVPSEQADSGYLFRYDSNTETVSKVEVRLINTRDQGVEIAGDISAGDLVVAAGAEFLHEGQKVSLFQPIH